MQLDVCVNVAATGICLCVCPSQYSAPCPNCKQTCCIGPGLWADAAQETEVVIGDQGVDVIAAEAVATLVNGDSNHIGLRSQDSHIVMTMTLGRWC